MFSVTRTGYQAIANAIWSLVSVASRTVTVTTNSDKTGYSLAADQAVNVTKVAGTVVASALTAGYFPADTAYHRAALENVLVGGRRDVHVGSIGVSVNVATNSDKSGYTLPQGSYEVTEFCQRGTVTSSAGTAGISTVNLTKTNMGTTGWSNPDGAATPARLTLGATAVTITTNLGSIVTTAGFEIADFAG